MKISPVACGFDGIELQKNTSALLTYFDAFVTSYSDLAKGMKIFIGLSVLFALSWDRRLSDHNGMKPTMQSGQDHFRPLSRQAFERRDFGASLPRSEQ